MTVTISFIFKSNQIKVARGDGVMVMVRERVGAGPQLWCPPARGAVLVNNNRLIAMH